MFSEVRGNQMSTIWNVSTSITENEITDFDLNYNSQLHSFSIQSTSVKAIEYGIYNITGQKITQNNTKTNIQTQLVLSKGIYILVIKSKEYQKEKSIK